MDVFYTRVQLHRHPQTVVKFKMWKITTGRIGFLNLEIISRIINSGLLSVWHFCSSAINLPGHPKSKSQDEAPFSVLHATLPRLNTFPYPQTYLLFSSIFFDFLPTSKLKTAGPRGGHHYTHWVHLLMDSYPTGCRPGWERQGSERLWCLRWWCLIYVILVSHRPPKLSQSILEGACSQGALCVVVPTLLLGKSKEAPSLVLRREGVEVHRQEETKIEA